MKLFQLFSTSQISLENEEFSGWTSILSSRSATFTCWIIITTVLLALVVKAFNNVGKFVSTKPVNLSQKVLEKFVESPSLPVIGPALHFFKHGKDVPSLLAKWSIKYSFCMRTKFFGKNILFVHDPELLKSILAANNPDHLEKKASFYKSVFVASSFNGLVTLPAKSWKPHRKTLNPLFSYEALKTHVGIYQNHAEKLVQSLMKNVGGNSIFVQNVPYSTIIHLKLLNIITEITFGKPFETLLGLSGAMKFLGDLQASLDIVGDTANMFSWMHVPLLGNFHPLKKKLDKHVKDFEDALKQIIKSHVPRPDSRFALDLMINSNWTDAEILAELETITIGGHEATAGALNFLLWLLAIEQSHQEACQQEIDQLFEEHEHSGQVMTVADFNEMKYLECCVKETLRLFPSFFIGTVRDLKSTLTLGEGMEVGAGSILAFSPYILHRNPELYPDPETFDPDRFLPENVRKRHMYAYLPFSAGPRNCIGWRASMLELVVISAVILRHFHIRTTDKREDIKIRLKFTIAPTREPNLTFESRNKCSKAGCCC